MKRIVLAMTVLTLVAAIGRAQTQQNPYNLDKVVNLKRFGGFPPNATDKLRKDGFVVTPAGWNQFFHVYESNEYLGIPSFITSDSILHTFHIFFDFSLRDIEENKLLGMLEELTLRMFELSVKDLQAAPPGMARDAAMRNVAYFAVGQALLSGKLPPMDAEASKLAAAEVELIKTAAAVADSPITRVNIDYSMFKPRGHYTRNDDLRRFFTAMMWYGIAPFVIKADDPLPALMVILSAKNLCGEGGPASLWQNIYEPTAFYAGVTDDLTPAIVWDVLGRRAPSPKELENPSWRNEAIEKILALSAPAAPGSSRKLLFRFMGQRYAPDSEVFNKVTAVPERAMPRGLDLMAALGIEEARGVLRETYREGESWPDYWKRLDEQQKRLAGIPPDQWKQNLYYRWIHLLKAVNEIPANNPPPFIQTRSWKLKSLLTSLASWAELRHDTILFVQQYVAMEGGSSEPEKQVVKGYVEPNPKLYAELRELIVASREGLQRRNLITKNLLEASNTLEKIVVFMEKVSEKELRGEALNNLDNENIRAYGSDLEFLTLRMIKGGGGGRWDKKISGPDRSVAVIADVFTGMTGVLEEAIGNVWEIYVVVSLGGKPYLTRGAVFSYYEFTQPVTERLTDEKWQQMLEDGKAPPMPEWTMMYSSEKPKSAIPSIRSRSSRP